MNYMLYSLRHKTSNGDHKLITKMFIEVIEKGASSHRLLYNVFLQPTKSSPAGH